MEIARGTRVGEYIVEEKIGEGGMGVVYRAAPEIGKRVAIKFLSPKLAEDREAFARFQNEARAACSIDHPNIIDILFFGTLDDKHPYFVMEHLEGRSLGQLIAERGPLPPDEILTILGPVADAVDAAHARGIVHRDLKPDNIFLVERQGRRQTVKVLDFGVAKLMAETQKLTQTGQIVGTPAFMAPEQCMAQKLDHTVDVYAFGAILYHALTRRFPLEADSLVELVGKHYRGDPPEPPSRFGAPASLDAPMERCLARDPARRYPSLGEALAAFRQAAGPAHGASDDAAFVSTAAAPAPAAAVPSVPPTAVKTPSTLSGAAAQVANAGQSAGGRRGPLVAGLAVAALAGAGAVVLFLGNRAPQEPDAAPAAVAAVSPPDAAPVPPEWTSCGHVPAQAPRVRYSAKLCHKDHQNSDGQPLRGAGAVIRQDRANVHRFGIRDAEDEVDPIFGDKGEREALAELFKRRLPRALERTILSGEPVVEVTVWSDCAGLRVLRP